MLLPGPFRGSEALEQGRLSRHQLRTHYRPVVPDVYVAKALVHSLRQRTIAACLWSQREGVVTGLAAAAKPRIHTRSAAMPKREHSHVHIAQPDGIA